MNVTILIVPVLLAILGVIIRFGKASWLISGYNTSSKYEKEKYDETALCKFVGNLLFGIAIIFLFIAAATVLNSEYLTTIVIIGVLLEVVLVISAIIYMNTGNRFKKK